MKICVIGTSHLGALKQGWDMVRDEFAGLDLVFFGSPGSSLRQLRTKGTRLVADDAALAKSLAYTSGGLSEIVIADYDAFLLYGVLFRLPRLRRGISMAVLRAVVEAQASQGLLVKTAKRVRKLTDKRLWLAASPLEVAAGDEVDTAVYHPHDLLLTALQRAFVVPDAVFLAQPAETMGPDLCTLARFGEGSLRLLPTEDGADHEAHPDSDVTHMNGAFGKLWLQANLPAICAHAQA